MQIMECWYPGGDPPTRPQDGLPLVIDHEGVHAWRYGSEVFSVRQACLSSVP
jgi:hypothetical protein